MVYEGVDIIIIIQIIYLPHRSLKLNMMANKLPAKRIKVLFNKEHMKISIPSLNDFPIKIVPSVII